MLRTELCPPQNSYTEALTPKVTIFGDEANKSKMRPLSGGGGGGVLV